MDRDASPGDASEASVAIGVDPPVIDDANRSCCKPETHLMEIDVRATKNRRLLRILIHFFLYSMSVYIISTMPPLLPHHYQYSSN